MSEFRTAYGPHFGVTFETGSESVVQQSAKDDCDINVIMARAAKGIAPVYQNLRQEVYGDMSELPDVHTAMVAVAQAKELFEQIPSDIRKRFDNDPAQFLEFVENPANVEDLVAMGLARKAPGPVPHDPVEQPAAAPPVAESDAPKGEGDV